MSGGHTPGPWRTEAADMFGDHNIVLADGGDDCRAIAAVVSNLRPPEEVAANAAVIAAAPDLLVALKVASDAINEMFRYFDGGETRGSYDGKPERAQLRKAGYAAKAALAKAGES